MLLENILDYCTREGIPIYMLEKKCGIGNGTIKRWKYSTPRLNSLQKIAKETGMTIEQLLK